MADSTKLVLPPPKKIMDYLDRYVIGQDLAKKSLSIGVYNHYKRINHNSQFVCKKKKTGRPSYDEYRHCEDYEYRSEEPQRVTGFKWLDEKTDALKLDKSNILM